MSNKVKKDILKLEEELLYVDFMNLKRAKNNKEYIEFKAVCDSKLKKLEDLKYDNLMELVSFYNGIILTSITNRYEIGGYLNTILPSWLARRVSSAYKAKTTLYYNFIDSKEVLWNINLGYMPADGEEGPTEYVGHITALLKDRTVHYKMANAEEYFPHDEIRFERVS